MLAQGSLKDSECAAALPLLGFSPKILGFRSNLGFLVFSESLGFFLGFFKHLGCFLGFFIFYRKMHLFKCFWLKVRRTSNETRELVVDIGPKEVENEGEI